MTPVVTPSNLGNEFQFGTEVPNKITVKVDGTSVVRDTDGTLHGASPTYDNTAKTLTFPVVNGAPPQVINLAEFLTDIHVDGASFNTTTSVLTLTDNDGSSPDVVIDLSAIKGVSTDADNVLINGTDGRAFLSQATIDTAAAAAAGASTDTGNLLSTGTDGKAFIGDPDIENVIFAQLHLVVTDAFGVAIGNILEV